MHQEDNKMMACQPTFALLSFFTHIGGHLGWVDLSEGGGGWGGRPWTEDVMLDYLESVLAVSALHQSSSDVPAAA